MKRSRMIFLGLIIVSIISIVAWFYGFFAFPFLFLFFPPFIFGGGFKGNSKDTSGQRPNYTQQTYCPNCGTYLQPQWNFCPKCSQPVNPKQE